MTPKLLENISEEDLKKCINKYESDKVFLVTGKGSFIKSGAKKFVENALKGIKYVRFSDFEENPKYEDAIRGTKVFLESDCKLIVAIGGGSTIDMAKLIRAFASNNNLNTLDLVKGISKTFKKGPPLIAIPTTAGTGSETTHFAVVYHRQKKYSLANKYILPEVAVLNTDLTMSQSKYLTACSGLDALSQAIESFWSINSSDESKEYAKEAITMLLHTLPSAVKNQDKKSRETVMKGAYLAGKAINISKTTAPHAISYAFTTFYGIPHGHAVFLTLPEFLEYNGNISSGNLNDSRGVEYVIETIYQLCDLLKVGNALEGKIFLKDWVRSLGIEVSLGKLKSVKMDYISKVVDNVNIERLANNPRRISRNELAALLEKIY